MKILSDILVKAGVVVEQNVSAANVSAAANLIGGTVWTYSAFKNNNNGNMALAFSGTTVSITTDAGNVINAFGNGNVAIGSNTNAGYKFDVNGSVRIGQSRLQSHEVYGALTVGKGSTGTDITALTVLAMGTGGSTNFRVRDTNNATDVFSVQENAYIGFGGTAFPTAGLTGFTFDASGVSSQAFNIVTRSNNTSSTYRGLVVTEGNLNGVSGGSFDSRYIEVKPSFNATGGVNYTIRGFYYNPTITNLSASTVNHIAFEATVGKVKLGDLSGSGVRMVVADANGLLSAQAFSANVNAFQEFTYTATAGQTTFAATYTVGQLLVYYNGSKLEPSEYTATDGTSVVLSPGVNAGDIIDIIAYQTGAGIGYGSLSATGPLTYNNTTGVFAIQKADSLKDGYLSSADWITFNNKVSTATLAGYLPLTGGTLTGALSGTSATFSTSVGVGGYGAIYSNLESSTGTFGSTVALISLAVKDGTYNPRSTISYKTQTGSAYSVIFDSTYSSGWAATNWVFASGSVGIGTQTSIGTSGEAATIAASGSNIITVRRTSSSNTTASRILFQAYDADTTLQNVGIVEAGLNGTASSPYLALFSGTNEAVRFTHLKNLTFNGTGVPSGIVQEVSGTTPLLGLDVNFRPTDLVNTTYAGAQLRIDMRSGQKPLNLFYRAAGSTTDTNLFNINTTGQVSIAGSFSYLSMDGAGHSGMPSGFAYGLFPYSGVGLGIGSVGSIRIVTNSADRIAITGTGQVLVGQTTTSYTSEKMIVSGPFRVHSGNEWDGVVISCTGTRVYYDHTGAEDDARWAFFGTDKHILYSNGNYWFAGSNVSDSRLKNSIKNINSSYLDKIKSLQLTSFKMNEDAAGVLKYGFIAQQVQNVLPEVVTGDVTKPFEYLGVDTNGLLALTIKSVQEEDAKVEELKSIVAQQQIEIESLKAQLGTN